MKVELPEMPRILKRLQMWHGNTKKNHNSSIIEIFIIWDGKTGKIEI